MNRDVDRNSRGDDAVETICLSIDGPDESFRDATIVRIEVFAQGWRSAHATADGVLKVAYAGGLENMIRPPNKAVA